MSAPSKNTILINGVGIHDHSKLSGVPPAEKGWKAWGGHFYRPGPCRVATAQLAGRGWKGFRLDATQAMNAPGDGSVRFCGRLFLLLEGPCAVILDRVKIANPGRMEARLHTFSRVKFDGNQAEIRGRNERLALAFAASVPSTPYRAEDALTTPIPGVRSTMLRWCTQDRTHADVTFATLLAPGGAKAKIALEEFPGHLMLRVNHKSKHRALKIARDLQRIRG